MSPKERDNGNNQESNTPVKRGPGETQRILRNPKKWGSALRQVRLEPSKVEPHTERVQRRDKKTGRAPRKDTMGRIGQSLRKCLQTRHPAEKVPRQDTRTRRAPRKDTMEKTGRSPKKC